MPFFTLCLLLAQSAAPSAEAPTRPPNIVLILADDLGYGELGCYGQKKIRTPHVDRLAAEGMRFTQYYSGAPVCAPARCVLLTGKHLPEAQIRDNRDAQEGAQEQEGQWPLRAGTVTLASRLHEAGYATGGFGKWGLGNATNSGYPCALGFDTFYGYYCQRVAHSYFPPYLNHNDRREVLNQPPVPGHFQVPTAARTAPVDYARFQGRIYAPDRILEEALQFVREHREGPFFLYLPFVEPHVAMQPPPASVAKYPEAWDSEPYLGDKGYTPHPRPHAGYAAMISDLDAHVGAVMAELQALGIDQNTLVLFTSDNGPTHDVGGVDTQFFDSTAGLRGRKGSVFEGGLRVPL
ncbi:MAG: sulfatase-like hydrolase/transferase, partial [Planctomycetes bacterium]|nr:sulfatase-like hydrolase/transferase [Planctomycetota bacterium]